jgi:hypothetical protein
MDGGEREMKRAVITLVAGFVLASQTRVYAHHSFAAEYDRGKPVTLTGTVTKVEWMNPHARFYVDVKDSAGATVNWEFELGSPNVLIMQGWRKNSLKEGDQVTVNGYMAKDGARLVNAGRVTLADGSKVFAGSSADGKPVAAEPPK